MVKHAGVEALLSKMRDLDRPAPAEWLDALAASVESLERTIELLREERSRLAPPNAVVAALAEPVAAPTPTAVRCDEDGCCVSCGRGLIPCQDCGSDLTPTAACDEACCPGDPCPECKLEDRG